MQTHKHMQTHSHTHAHMHTRLRFVQEGYLMDTVVTQEEVNVMTTHITEYCNSLGVDVSPAMQATVTPVDLRTISGEGRGVGQKEGKGERRECLSHTTAHNNAHTTPACGLMTCYRFRHGCAKQYHVPSRGCHHMRRHVCMAMK